MINWDTYFENYINQYKNVNNIDSGELNTQISTSVINTKNNDIYMLLKDLKFNSGWLIKNKISILQNLYDKKNTYALTILEDNIDFIEKIKLEFNKIYNKNFYMPQKKIFTVKNFKINNIDFDKVSFLINYDNNKEYIKFNPINNFDIISKLIKNGNIQILFRPFISKFNTEIPILGIKIDSIILDWNNNLLKFPFIKKIIDIRKFKETRKNMNNKNEPEKQEIIILDSKFNKFKNKKSQIINSNSKILNIINKI